MLVKWLSQMPSLRDVHPKGAVLVSAMRQWVMAGKLGQSPMDFMVTRLGSARAAAHVHLLLEEIGCAWPEPFCVSPPCCPRLSHDEALMTDMLALGAAGDRPAFDRLTRDLLPDEVRERLFLSFSMLDRVMAWPGRP